ncbi:AAA domain containing protein [uncultured Caudovirales phage]|uniref:AAA domain containing protein n=1 Tax=uncultured Caudovirales phage TaxID=2100421 RepID=A0A6J5KTV7_9CAUD|nr:AAA domain containing protein [uncultured Caudovirales phage]CAB5209087.1 AAA domain containing protein [uncultured Caudovirales phage]
MAEILSRTVGPKGAKKSLRKAFKNQRPIFLWGPPGIGKSDIIKQLGSELDAHVIDVRLSLWEPTDIKGIPFFDSVNETMKWAPPSELPSAEMAKEHKQIILFLDEMNSAAPAVQAAAYQLILNRRVGTYHLPDNVVLVAAGNRETDKGVTFRMPAPLANRFVHLEMTVDWDDYFEWAVENNIHKDVVGFLSFSKKDLYDFDPKSSSRAFATPRSWSFVSELLIDDDTDAETLTDLVSGSVGEGLAVKFMAHRKVASKMPNPTDILSGKVTKMESKEISAMYSLTVSLCYELKDACDKNAKDWNGQVNYFFQFMMDNFETELVIMGTKLALSTYKLPLDPDEIKCFDDFHAKFGKYIAAATEK